MLRLRALSVGSALAAILLSSPALAGNGFALHAYGSPGSDADCWNGKADWSNKWGSGTIGQGTGYAYANVSGDVSITAVPSDPNLQVTWSSQDASWVVRSGCTVGSLTCVVDNGNYVDVNFGEPAPAIASLSPTQCDSGSPDLTVTVDSADESFTHQSSIWFGGLKLTTTFVSTSRLTAVIPAGQLTSAGVFPVTVQNPAAPAFGPHCSDGLASGACPSVNGGTSNAVDFTIVVPPPDASTPPPDADAFSPDAAEPRPDAAEPQPDAANPPDAATPPDAGVPTPPDAGEPLVDAGESEDATPVGEDAALADAEVAVPDSATAVWDAARADGSAVALYDLGGCGCSASGPALFAFGALGLGVRRRRS